MVELAQKVRGLPIYRGHRMIRGQANKVENDFLVSLHDVLEIIEGPKPNPIPVLYIVEGDTLRRATPAEIESNK